MTVVSFLSHKQSTKPSANAPFDTANFVLPLDEVAVDALLGFVLQQARQLHIPVSHRIDPHVLWNYRSTKRLGCCYVGKSRQYTFTIEISSALPVAGVRQCLNTLAHEILHTCAGCRNHGEKWKYYAGQMSLAYGYDIRRVTDAAANGIALPEKEVHYQWLVTCQNCGNCFFRQRNCSVTSHPDRYRCARCHTGKLTVENIP